MAPTPPMGNSAGPTPAPVWFSPPGTEDRIRRNVACINCRNSKVRCKASPVPGQPCQRCAKLQISCVVDKSHKRVTKRSKLEQLEQELRSLKEVVHPTPSGETSWSPPSPRLPSSRHRQDQQSVGSAELQLGSAAATAAATAAAVGAPQVPTPLPEVPLSAGSSRRASGRPPKQEPTSSRVVADQVVSGGDIDWYFDQFLRYFHPFLPILRKKDPDECYDGCPTLFWVVVFVACRRYCRNDKLYGALADHLAKDIWACMSTVALGTEAIHAVLILAMWPLPTVRLVTDPSPAYAAVAMNACLTLGFHHGRGSHPDFCFGSRCHLKATDQESASTCLASCLVSQSSTATSGLPPPNILVKDEQCKQVLQGAEWAELLSMYEVFKFLNRFCRFIYAQTLSAGHVTNAVVMQWEDELDQVQPLISHRSDSINVLLLAARLQIQQYYFFAPPDEPVLGLRTNTLRVFQTSRVLISTVYELETRHRFLGHSPYWVFRAVLDACSIILFVLLSNYAPDISPDDANLVAQQSCNCVLGFSTRRNDMPYRAGTVMETFWMARHLIPKVDRPPAAWPTRLGSGVTFVCARRFKNDLAVARKSSESINKRLEAIQPSARPEETADTAPKQDDAVPSAGIDPFQDVDWSMFMDDFGWAGEDAVFLGLP